jgi:hypothetical protein
MVSAGETSELNIKTTTALNKTVNQIMLLQLMESTSYPSTHKGPV